MPWFDNSFKADQGYYVDQILPTAKARVKAPGSGGNTANNQPLEAVAFTARVGGVLYLAYCVPTKTVPCAHIALWRDSSAKRARRPRIGDRACLTRRDRGEVRPVTCRSPGTTPR